MMQPGIGDTFQRETKYQRGHLPGGWLDWASKPETYKGYPSAPKVRLSPPQLTDGAPVWDVIRQRRSVRSFQDAPLKEAELSQLLWAAQGITRVIRGFGLRTAPSAGALYPVETYLVIHSVEGIEPGVYHYAVETHELDQLQVGDFREAVARAALDQKIAYRANVVFGQRSLNGRNGSTSREPIAMSTWMLGTLLRTWPWERLPWDWAVVRSQPSTTTRRTLCWAWTV